MPAEPDDRRVHLHTLSCPTPEAFRRIEAALDAKGLLYKKEE